MMQEIWLPEDGVKDSKITGRFIEQDHTYTTADGEKRTRRVTMLLHKVPGSNDVSASLVKDNSDGVKLKTRFATAWADFENRKAAEASAGPVVATATAYGIKGTPIEDADFIGADRMAFFKSMGFLTIEQIADMSDSVCANFSGGVRLRKKAAEFLASAKG